MMNTGEGEGEGERGREREREREEEEEGERETRNEERALVCELERGRKKREIDLLKALSYHITQCHDILLLSSSPSNSSLPFSLYHIVDFLSSHIVSCMFPLSRTVWCSVFVTEQCQDL